jgi:4-hydroxybenzoate polyprenyltransferase
MLGGYLLLTFLYSAYFKNKLLIDVIVLAGLYTYRIVAGGVAVDITVTAWLLAFSMFIFLSIAFAKRYNELRYLQAHGIKAAPGRAYLFDEMDLLLSLGPTLGCLSILVLALYISESPEVGQLYASAPLLWFLCPVLLYWIMRLWFIARRGELPEDPVAFALTDTNSYFVGAIVVALLFVASRWPILS